MNGLQLMSSDHPEVLVLLQSLIDNIRYTLVFDDQIKAQTNRLNELFLYSRYYSRLFTIKSCIITTDRLRVRYRTYRWGQL